MMMVDGWGQAELWGFRAGLNLTRNLDRCTPLALKVDSQVVGNTMMDRNNSCIVHLPCPIGGVIRDPLSKDWKFAGDSKMGGNQYGDYMVSETQFAGFGLQVIHA